jgi:hypothetical protein
VSAFHLKRWRTVNRHAIHRIKVERLTDIRQDVKQNLDFYYKLLYEIKAKVNKDNFFSIQRKMAFFFIFSETDRHLSHVYTKEGRPPPKEKKRNQVITTTTPPINTTSFFFLFWLLQWTEAPREFQLITVGGRKRRKKWIKNTSHLNFFFTSSKYFEQSRLGLIGWEGGDGEMFGERNWQKNISNKVERKTRSSFIIKGY